jgi:tetratricopeptide (TPR) repeat protein
MSSQKEGKMERGSLRKTRARSSRGRRQKHSTRSEDRVGISAARSASRAAAERAHTEAECLRGHQTADSFRKAVEKYEEASQLYHTVGERQKEAECLSWIGVLSARLGDPRKALGYLDQALAITRATKDRGGEATVLHNIGKAHLNLGEKQKALEYFRQALPVFRDVQDRIGEATTLHNVGSVYTALGEPQKALEHYTQCAGDFSRRWRIGRGKRPRSIISVKRTAPWASRRRHWSITLKR